ncbi:tetratricopeptide repeat protein [bacterium]|jgi:TolA-binding protein|nr:tetratricopeptide repeat protein [bacterium]
MKKIFVFAAAFFILSFPNLIRAENIQGAKEEYDSGNYKKAYDILILEYISLKNEAKEKDQLLDAYRTEIQRMEDEQKRLRSRPAGVQNEEAERIWKEAWSIQKTAIHEKSGKERDQFLLNAIDSFREITLDYPDSARAAEAQYRIGRLYYRYLGNKKKGYDEFQKFLQAYPYADTDLIRDANKCIADYEKRN